MDSMDTKILYVYQCEMHVNILSFVNWIKFGLKSFWVSYVVKLPVVYNASR